MFTEMNRKTFSGPILEDRLPRALELYVGGKASKVLFWNTVWPVSI